MPNETYNINNKEYASTDFFFNNTPLIFNTLNLKIPELYDWCNSKKSLIGIDKPSDKLTQEETMNFLFNNQIIDIVRSNKDSFINDYLKGNVTVSSEFKNVSTTTTVNGMVYDDKNGDLSSMNTNGSIVFKDGITKMDNIALGGKYSTDRDGNLFLTINKAINKMRDVLINGSNRSGSSKTAGSSGSKEDGSSGSSGTDGTSGSSSSTDGYGPGGPEYITATDVNPRCRYQPSCKDTHQHTTCRTQIKKDKDGNSYCECVCDDSIINDGLPHTHCNPYYVGDANASGSGSGSDGKSAEYTSKYGNDPKYGYDAVLDTLYNGATGQYLQWQIANQSFKRFNDSIKEMKFNISDILPSINGVDLTTSASYTQENINKDQSIREVIYNYYIAVANNKDLQKQVLTNSSFDATANQSIKDATISYRTKYLELFNIISGIFMATGYIYLYSKTLPFFNKK